MPGQLTEVAVLAGVMVLLLLVGVLQLGLWLWGRCWLPEEVDTPGPVDPGESRWEVTTTWPRGDGPGPSPGQEDRVMLVRLRTPEGVDQVDLLNDLLSLGWDSLVDRACDSGWREQHPRLYRGKKIPTDAVSWSIEVEDG